MSTPWETALDRMRQIELRTFGASVSYEPPEAAAFAVTVIWSGSELPSGIQARCWARIADFTGGPARGGLITRCGKIYRVHDVEPKDEATAWLYLKYVEAAP